jgi:hypothetical protein
VASAGASRWCEAKDGSAFAGGRDLSRELGQPASPSVCTSLCHYIKHKYASSHSSNTGFSAYSILVNAAGYRSPLVATALSTTGLYRVKVRCSCSFNAAV